VCDLETSRIGAPYVYDISNLRVNIIIAFFNILHSKKYFQANLSSLLGYIFYATYAILYSETFFGTTDNVLTFIPHKQI